MGQACDKFGPRYGTIQRVTALPVCSRDFVSAGSLLVSRVVV